MQINSSNNSDIRSFAYQNLLSNGNSSSSLLNKILAITLIVVVSATSGFFVGTSGIVSSIQMLLNNQGSNSAKVYSQAELDALIDARAYDFNLYNQIIGNLKDRYVDPAKVDDKKLFDSSVKGLVQGIGDPNTVYMNAEDYQKYKESFSGKFEGIGVRLSYDKNRIIVDDVFEGSPAEGAGVKQGFVFLEVDGQNVEAVTLEELVAKVRGQSGSKVKIKFFDPISNQNVDKEITRGAVTVESIRLKEKDSETVILEVARFTEPTLDEWKSKWDKAVIEINSKGYKNVILDLRGNLGGYLDAGVYAANDFLEPGKIIVTERTRSDGDKEIRSTNKSPRLKDKNVVVLINGGTASASEILAGALKFNNSYKIIGTKSYGKGTVQVTYSLYNGGALKITTEYWLLPDGKKLNTDNPIQPDIVIEQDQEKFRQGIDQQLNEAISLIKK